MYLCAEQCFAGLCFPDTPNELCLLQGPRNGFCFPRSCHVWGPGEPGTGSFRRHHAMMPSPCFLLSAAVCWDQQHARALSHPVLLGLSKSSAHPECSTEGMEMAQSSPTAPVPLDVGCGGRAAFFLLWLSQSQKTKIF